MLVVMRESFPKERVSESARVCARSCTIYIQHVINVQYITYMYNTKVQHISTPAETSKRASAPTSGTHLPRGGRVGGGDVLLGDM